MITSEHRRAIQRQASRRYRARQRALGIPHDAGRTRKGNRFLLELLKARPCADCGQSYPACAMDFDHRPGETKVAAVSNLTHKPAQVVLAEVAKCDVVCANCHRLRTWNRHNGHN